MGAGLGLLLGTGMNALGGYAKGKILKQQQHDDLLLSTYQQNPTLATTPDAQSFLKKKYGGDVADMFMNFGKATEQMQQSVGGAMAPQARISGAANPSGSVPPQDPMGAHISQLDSEINRLRGVQTRYAGNPQFAKFSPMVQNHIDDLQHQRDQLTQQQFQTGEKEQDRQQRQEFHADTEADRAQMRQIQEQNADLNKQLRTIMAGIAQDREKDEQQKNFDAARKNLAGQLTNINKLLTASNPPDAATIQPILTSYNSQLKALKSRADRLDIEYNEDEFKPLNSATDVPKHPWLGAKLGGVKASIAGTPLTAGAATTKPDGVYQKDGKLYTVTKGKITGVSDAGS